MAATIFDVAKRAGVSIGTVSRVVNNRDRVHPDTRERVLKAIRELDYHANALARGLASQETATLGLVIPQVNDPFFFQVVRGVEEAASAANYALLIASQSRLTASEHRYLHLFRRGHVDAMVLASIEVHVHEVQEIMRQGIPIVLVQLDIGKNIPTFLADNYSGGRGIAEHLVLEHHYRRVAFITGTNHTPDSRERLRALRDVLEENNLDLPAHYIVQGDYLRDSGYQAMQQLLNLSERPEAVFAANDQMAIDAMMAIRERGLRIPEDIAVVGFDDIPMASYVSPPLTTVHQPVYELGWHAAHMALEIINSDQAMIAPRKMLLPTSPVIRRSCGC
ncbi:MAG: LacI family DNA-binding transcriptional regulator [Chloroflexi bacterium]|nr:LacI family DNA-binding transcriptional regulator [Chloroflexota bacterium]